MPSEGTKILELNQYQKSDKAPFIVSVDLECIIEKTDGCKNIPQNSSAQISERLPSGFAMSTISSFKSIEIDEYRSKDCESVWKSFVNP